MVQKCTPHPHCLEPLQSVVIRVDFEGHGQEVWSELRNGPNNGEAFQLGGRVDFLCLIEGARRAADDALLAFPNLSEDHAEACS